jgi:hypothetical protein
MPRFKISSLKDFVLKFTNSPKFRFFLLCTPCLIVQFVIIGFSYIYEFPLFINMVLSFYFCWNFHSLINITYPVSLQVSKEKKESFLLSFLFSFLMYTGVGLFSFCVFIFAEFLWGSCSNIFCIIFLHFHNNTMLCVYPLLPFYIGIALSYMIIGVFLVGLAFLNHKSLVTKTKEFCFIIWHNKMFNTETFLLKMKEKNKKISFFVYFLLVFGLVGKTPQILTVLFALSAYHDMGLSYCIYIVVNNVVSYVLLLPNVNTHIKNEYCFDSLSLLNWNMFSAIAKIQGKALLYGGGLALGTRVAEITTNTAIDVANTSDDLRVNDMQDSRRIDVVVRNIRNAGYGKEGENWVSHRISKTQFSETPPLLISEAARKQAEFFYAKAEAAHPYKHTPPSDVRAKIISIFKQKKD